MELTIEQELEMFGDKEVRWYQGDAVKLTINGLKEGIKRILIESPTGTGKTVISALIFRSMELRKILNIPADRKLKILFVAHIHRLLSQAEKTYADLNNIELILHSAFSQLPTDIDWDITCIDEAHHEAMLSIQYHLDKLADKPIIGLTATPDRADGMLLKFQLIINTISRQQAVDEGFLSQTDIHTIIDSPTLDKTNIIKDVINTFGSQMRQTMVFVRTLNEVKNVTEHLLSNGYSAVGLLNQNSKEVDNILNDFSSKKIQFVVNCGKLGEGIDVKGCTDVILGRQFGSYNQLNQVIGRTARPDSDSVVWEFINPLSSSNLDTTIVVGKPKSHMLHFKKSHSWQQREFNYQSFEKVNFNN